MDVARSRRRVKDEVVEFVPVAVGNELLQCRGCHTSTPKRCRILVDKETDAKQLHAILLNGGDELSAVFLNSMGTGILHVEHLRHRGSEDVGVEQSHLVAESCQRDGEIGRDGRLAYSTLTGAYGDDVLHLRQQVFHIRTWCRLELCLHRHLYVLAAMVADSSLGSLHRRLEERIGVARKEQDHRHRPCAACLVPDYRRGVCNHFAFY